jgi:hypothetical protein
LTGKVLASAEVEMAVCAASAEPAQPEVSGVAMKSEPVNNSGKLEPTNTNTTTCEVEPSAGREATDVNGLAVAMEDEGVQFVQAAEGDNQILVQMDDNQAVTDSDQVQIFQTPGGVILVQKPDGTVLQIQHPAGEPIPLETVQALLAMDGQGALEQMEETEIVEQ